jgi:hypothetical protein
VEEYLVELYLPRCDEAALADAVRRARCASDELMTEGKQVRYVRTIFVPADEICFHLYEAGGAAGVAEAARRAAIVHDRIVGVVSLDDDERHITTTNEEGQQ